MLRKKPEFRPVRCEVSDAKLQELCTALELETMSTSQVSAELEGIARRRPNYKAMGLTYVNVPLPVPLRRKRVLRAYLETWWHTRSPSWNIRGEIPVGHYGPVVFGAVRRHVAGQVAAYKRRPVTGDNWGRHMARVLALLDEVKVEKAPPTPQGFFPM